MKKVVNKWKHSVCAAHTKLNAKNIQGVGLKKKQQNSGRKSQSTREVIHYTSHNIKIAHFVSLKHKIKFN